jgi:hypothetical protein
MKKLFLLFGVVLLFVGLNSCSNTTTAPIDQATLSIETGFDGYPSVSSFNKGNAGINGLTVDSIFIKKVRILIKEIKVTVDTEDRWFDDDYEGNDHKKFKTGPYLLTVEYGTNTVFTISTNLTPGLFDKIKLEFHRFSSSELSNYINDNTFKDFATGDRYSVIIEGTVYSGGIGENFTYNSNVTANLELKLEQLCKLEAKKHSRFRLLVTPSLLFKHDKYLLDPRDSKNENEIDDLIKHMLKLKLK